MPHISVKNALAKLLPLLQEMIHNNDSMDLMTLLDEMESSGLKLALIKHRGNRTHASGNLGMNRTTLLEKMRKLGIKIPSEYHGRVLQ